MCRTFQGWFRQFVIWEAAVHVVVASFIIAIFADRFDITEVRAMAWIAAFSFAGASIAYLVFKHCLRHPKRLFRKIDTWMKVFFAAEYFGFLIGVSIILWATASNFDGTEIQSIGFIAAANAVISRWSWKIYRDDKLDYRKIGAGDA